MVTQYSGSYLDSEALHTIFDLNDGRRFIASYVVGATLCNLDRVCTPDEAALVVDVVRYSNPAQGLERELRLGRGGDIYGVTAQGEWSELVELYALAMDGKALAPARIEDFRRTGSVVSPAAADDNRVICSCASVPRSALHAAIARGVNTLDGLRRETRCGTGCGGCVPSVRELLGEPGWTPARISDEVAVCDGIRTFRLQPVTGQVAAGRPGQHIVLEAEIAGKLVQRPYTLSAPTQRGYYEITVKREPMGVLSRWLFDERRPDSPLRVSRPEGDYVCQLGSSDVVCLVAGIGVTPALAILRAIVDQKLESQLHIDYSARGALAFAYAAELTGAAAARSNIEVVLRDTSRDGRLDSRTLAALIERYPRATYFLCGTQSYLNTVTGFLTAAGVPPERVRIEVFHRVGDAPGATSIEARSPTISGSSSSATLGAHRRVAASQVV